MIEFDELCFRYHRGAPNVLTNVNGYIAAGERVALVGPSGSGKSTLLMLVYGLIAPTSGTLDVRTNAALWVHQDPRTFPRRTVRDNVALGAMHSGQRWELALNAAGRWLDMVGIGHLVDHQAVSISGGERQRVCLARALNSGRELLLLDEPTAQLDRKTAIDTMETFLEVCGHDRTVLAATHDPSILGLFDRCVELTDGQLHQLS